VARWSGHSPDLGKIRHRNVLALFSKIFADFLRENSWGFEPASNEANHGLT
jgi:hypothetical protein